MNVGISGISGRMGRLIARRILSSAAFQLAGGWNRSGTADLEGVPIFSDPGQLVQASQVVVDFSQPEATETLLAALLEQPRPLVCGTTALSPETQAKLDRLAQIQPVVYAANFSVGVTVLNELVRWAGRALGPGFDVEIVETHHRHKKDAPSGTAMMLARTAARHHPSGNTEAPVVVGRQGTGLTRGNEVVVHALRGGSITGEHTVFYLGENEVLSLEHRALSRELFVDGVMRALSWISGQPPGRYEMKHVLNLMP